MALNMNKLTEKAQKALVAAQDLAQEMNPSAIETEHLLAALLEQSDGAPPLKHTIQRRVLDPLAMQVLDGRIRDGEHIVVDVERGELVFRREDTKQKEKVMV